MPKDSDYIDAAELLGGFMLKWVVCKMLGSSTSTRTKPRTQPTEEEPTPSVRRRAIVDEDNEVFREARYVCAFAGVADTRALNRHVKAGYFPEPVKKNPFQWHSSDLFQWQAWKDEKESRRTFQMWRNSGEEGWDG